MRMDHIIMIIILIKYLYKVIHKKKVCEQINKQLLNVINKEYNVKNMKIEEFLYLAMHFGLLQTTLIY